MMIRVPATGPRGFSGCTTGISSRLLGLGDDDTSATDTAIYDTPTPVTTPITILDTSSNPLYSDIVTPSDYSSATGPIDQSGTPITPITLSSSELNAINALPVSSVIPPSALPSMSQLASVIQTGTSSGLNANQILRSFHSAMYGRPCDLQSNFVAFFDSRNESGLQPCHGASVECDDRTNRIPTCFYVGAQSSIAFAVRCWLVGCDVFGGS